MDRTRARKEVSVRGRSADARGRWARRAAAPLAGAALVVVAVLERVRRRRQKGSTDTMEANKQISRRMIEDVLNAGRYDAIDELVAPKFVNHDPSVTEDMTGPEGIRQLAETYRTAFPDLKVKIEEQIAERDRVATRWSARGTHRGPLLGIDPTGKESSVTGITIDRIENGKIVESWNNWDTLGLLQQLGVVPALAQA
jgi:steroid delta-isomerase-like uncharacterized protein